MFIFLPFYGIRFSCDGSLKLKIDMICLFSFNCVLSVINFVINIDLKSKMLIFLFGIKIVHLMRLEISFDVFKSEFFSSALVSSSCLAFNKLFL